MKIASDAMPTLMSVSRLGPHQRKQILELVQTVTAARGVRPLSDDAWIALRSTKPTGFRAVLAYAASDESAIVGYAQLDEASSPATCEVVTQPGSSDASLKVRLLQAAGAKQPIQWWAFGADAEQAAIAGEVGLVARRTLLQLRRSLPTEIDFALTTRSFVPGEDNDEWIRVNNRAFAWHPEQGGWTRDRLARRMTEPWFDAHGFLLHHVAGRLAGFCWTKIHDNVDPALGEIYVIAADPDFAGRGLGQALTLAGLHSLAQRGLTVGILFVDASNESAIRMYDRLGFTTFRTDILYGPPTERAEQVEQAEQAERAERAEQVERAEPN